MRYDNDPKIVVISTLEMFLSRRQSMTKIRQRPFSLTAGAAGKYDIDPFVCKTSFLHFVYYGSQCLADTGSIYLHKRSLCKRDNRMSSPRRLRPVADQLRQTISG